MARSPEDSMRPPTRCTRGQSRKRCFSGESKCRRWESNPHGVSPPPDFESGASANFATPAAFIISPAGVRLHSDALLRTPDHKWEHKWSVPVALSGARSGSFSSSRATRARSTWVYRSAVIAKTRCLGAGWHLAPIRPSRVPRDGPEPVFEVSILIDPDLKGRGIGLAALALARSLVPNARLLAEILPQNTASLRVFQAAGYQPCGDGLYSHAAFSPSPVAVAER